MAGNAPLDKRVEAIRRFNRFYTQKIGVVQEQYLSSRLSLAKARILYELAHREDATASELSRDLGLDAGYLSRTLRDFEERGLVLKKTSGADRRQSLLTLTRKGRRVLEPLEQRAHAETSKLLSDIPESNQKRLVAAIQTIEDVLGERPAPGAYTLRQHRAGDMGLVIHRHGVLYANAYGWNAEFEALVAKIAGEFLEHYDAKRERCWIAEKDGDFAGSVFLVKKDDRTAKLRLLLVEPSARGFGIGGRLVDECIRFAREGGYRRIILWTQSVLTAARRIYERAGFTCVEKQPHHSFGHDLVGETWELDL